MYEITRWIYTNFSDVSEYGNPVTDLQVHCPKCGVGRKKHLHVSIEKQVFHCFRCDYAGSWGKLVKDVTGLPFPLAMAELYVKPRMVDWDKSISKLTADEEINENSYAVTSLPEGFISILKSTTDDARLAKMYLKQRGFGKKYWKRYNFGVAESIPGRLIIPIEDDYWQARSLYKWMKPKYINPKHNSSAYIFNSSALDLYKEVGICEGVFSAMSVAENFTAMIGKNMTKERFDRYVNSNANKFIVALDSDALSASLNIAERLKRAGKEVELWVYDSGDPAENNGVIEKSTYDFRSHIKNALR